LGAILEKFGGADISLEMITNRGVKVYPNGRPETFCTDHWRCRFISSKKIASGERTPILYTDIIDLLKKLESSGLGFIKLENLYEFNGKRGYSLAQGQ
jgi:isocitrate dehydrogenase